MTRLLLLALALLLCGCLPPVSAAAPTVTATSVATASSTPVLPSATPYPTVTAPARLCVVETGYEGGTVNVRAGAGMSYAVVDVVQQGEQLAILSINGDTWQMVATPRNVVGWFVVERWCK